MSQSPSRPMPFGSPRASPFRRPESPLTKSPSAAAARGTTSTPTSPTKALSPSLSPEKHNPFVRRPSQLAPSQERDRPTSPFARPSSRLSVVESPTRATSPSARDESTPTTPRNGPSPTPLDVSVPTSASSRTLTSPSPPDVASPSPTPSPTPSRTPTISASNPQSPTLGTPIHLDGAPPSSPPSYLSPSPSRPSGPVQRPQPYRTVTSSTAATVRPFSLQPATTPTKRSSFSSLSAATRPSPSYPAFPSAPASGPGNYNHIPPPLLRSMRESFEVLDTANSGTITSASLAEMLNQLGMDASPRALSAFFPPNAPPTLNLARFLDILAAPYAHLSQPDELSAAFAAFDVDDSGQIDLAELRDAVLHTAPEPGADDFRLAERDVDAVMKDFSARRAFGAKGLFHGGGATAAVAGRGDVFKYRDFMATVTGGAADVSSETVEVA